MSATQTAPAHYLFTEEHEMLRASIAAWARDRVQPYIDQWEAEREFPREIFEELGGLGYLGAQYPEEYGGQGSDLAANIVLIEELSRIGAESVSMAIGVHTAMATPQSSSSVRRSSASTTSLTFLRDGRSLRSASPSPTPARMLRQSEPARPGQREAGC
ncbi:MAG: acyl-CoA dehydrogenase family protein [Dehalococcoidia bacterium]|nr:acyl-CoA dehydrogenase family protein [Dehalococcoidia bacterium]